MTDKETIQKLQENKQDLLNYLGEVLRCTNCNHLYQKKLYLFKLW